MAYSINYIVPLMMRTRHLYNIGDISLGCLQTDKTMHAHRHAHRKYPKLKRSRLVLLPSPLLSHHAFSLFTPAQTQYTYRQAQLCCHHPTDALPSSSSSGCGPSFLLPPSPPPSHPPRNITSSPLLQPHHQKTDNNKKQTPPTPPPPPTHHHQPHLQDQSTKEYISTANPTVGLLK